MKFLISTLLVILPYAANASSNACTDFNTQTRIAREAVKSLIALAELPDVVAYYGGVQEDDGGVTVVNVLPHFQYSKDWYKVSVRNSDCRVLAVSLFVEKIPLE